MSATTSSPTKKTVRVFICKNGDPPQQAKAVVVDKDFSTLLLQAKNKLRMKKVNRIFNVTKNGAEIFESKEPSVDSIEANDVIAFSLDKDFIQATTASKQQQKQKELEAQGIISTLHSKNDVQDVEMRVLIKESWLEDEAVNQLEKCAKTLKGIHYAIGMPDLHPGKGFPIGTSFAAKNIIYPSLIGSDIGCGMSLFQLDEFAAKARVDKWVPKIADIDGPFLEDLEPWREKFNVKPTAHDTSLGTIGGGNHFAELQEIVEVKDAKALKEIGLDENKLFLLVHSGSRGLGHEILTQHEDKFGATSGFDDSTQDAKEYMEKHDHACSWARLNRALIAYRFLSCLNLEGECKIDVWHNNVTKKQFENGSEFYLHRKGAAPADLGAAVIPGSRGSYSYLVMPTEKSAKSPYSGYSLAHGAGRKYTRGKALQMGKASEKIEDLATTELGSRVICEDSELMYEEMPQAYKSIDSVVGDLEEFGLITIIAVLKPLITYKTKKRNK